MVHGSPSGSLQGKAAASTIDTSNDGKTLLFCGIATGVK